jgi:hypothetical protein
MAQIRTIRIFISYRRDDTQAIADRIYERLCAAFGAHSIFKDVNDIPPGKDFRAVLQDAVLSSNVMLVIIGRQWGTITDSDGHPRLHTPGDFVRLEVERALQTPNMTVIPVLVNNAQMPPANLLPPSLHELAYRNAMTVRNDPDFANDIDRLIRQLEGKPVREEPPPAITQTAPGRNGPSRGCSSVPLKYVFLGILALVVILLAGGTAWSSSIHSIEPCDSRHGRLFLNSRQTWELVDGAGSRIGIRLYSPSSFDVRVRDPDGYFLGEKWSYDNQNPGNVVVSDLKLPQSGTYEIEVSGGLFSYYEIELFGDCN